MLHAGPGWKPPPALTLPGFQRPDSGISRVINVTTASRGLFPPSAEKVSTSQLAWTLQAWSYGSEICLILVSIAGASRISDCWYGLCHTEMHPSALRRLFQLTTPERRLKKQPLKVVFLGADGLVPLWSVSAPQKMETWRRCTVPLQALAITSVPVLSSCPPPAEPVLWESQTLKGSLVYRCLGKLL